MLTSGYGVSRDPTAAGGFSIPVSREMYEDAVAAERALILSTRPMMSEARLAYWMRCGGWSAFFSFHVGNQGRSRDV